MQVLESYGIHVTLINLSHLVMRISSCIKFPVFHRYVKNRMPCTRSSSLQRGWGCSLQICCVWTVSLAVRVCQQRGAGCQVMECPQSLEVPRENGPKKLMAHFLRSWLQKNRMLPVAELLTNVIILWKAKPSGIKGQSQGLNFLHQPMVVKESIYMEFSKL